MSMRIFHLVLATGILGFPNGLHANPKSHLSAEKFRDIFHTYLNQRQDPRIPSVEELIFLPSPELTTIDYELDQQDPLVSITKKHAKYTPEDQFFYSREQPIKEIVDLEGQLREGGPITIVIVPGIFGEFIPNRPFEELIEAQGSFYDRWHQELQSETDTVYSLEKLDYEERPLDEIVELASIDDYFGQNLVNLIYLRPRFSSLETYGTLDESTSIYLKRLTKVFNLIPKEAIGSLYLLGYSRGTTVALDVIAKSRQQQSLYPWSKQIKGHIGLVGVYYGSEVANEAVINTDSPVFQTFEIFRKLSEDLEIPSEDSTRSEQASLVFRNTMRWAAAARSFYQNEALSRAMMPESVKKEIELLGHAQPSFLHLASIFYKIAFEYLNLNQPVSNYGSNIIRYQILLREILEGIETLTTPSRLEWWRQNTIPGDIAMYSVTGTLPNKTYEDGSFSVLTKFPGYGHNTYDYQVTLRGSFYTLAELTGNQLNDSQMTLARSHYWPEAASVINPDQEPLESHLLAIMGTHHWGCSYPIVFENRNGQQNEFPRDILLKSIASFIAIDKK